MFMCDIVPFSVYIQKTETTENSNFRLFAANERRKWQTFIFLLQTEIENGSLFSLVGKR